MNDERHRFGSMDILVRQNTSLCSDLDNGTRIAGV
jgi:hypothetical protein